MILYIKGKLHQVAKIVGIISKGKNHKVVVKTDDGFHAINSEGKPSSAFSSDSIELYADMVGDKDFKVPKEFRDDC